MIDWKNLEPLPRKQRETRDRERLAAASHARNRAKHKGRNHWRNWERRQMALEAKRERQAMTDKAKASYRRYTAEVRAYWQGVRTEHPAKP